MIKIKVAGLVIQIDNQFEEIKQFCRLYWAEDWENPDFAVHAAQKEYERSKLWFWEHEKTELSDAVAERDYMQHKIYPQLPAYDAFWLHACVVEIDGEAYAFSAPSGFGKTTHARLWKRLFGERAHIINGDNPIIRLKDDIFYAYGTPWCGKERWSVNTGVPLKAVCYIAQSENNVIEQLDKLAAFHRLVRFSRVYQKPYNLEKMLALYERMAESVPFYQMNCNTELEAARVSYEGMSGKKVLEYG